MRTIRFYSNLYRVRSISKDWRAKQSKPNDIEKKAKYVCMWKIDLEHTRHSTAPDGQNKAHKTENVSNIDMPKNLK